MRNTSHIFHRIGSDLGFILGFGASVFYIKTNQDINFYLMILISIGGGFIVSHIIFKLFNILGPQRPKREINLEDDISAINERIYDGYPYYFNCPVCGGQTSLREPIKRNIIFSKTINCFYCHTPLYLENEKSNLKAYGYHNVNSLDVFFSNIWNYGKVGYKFWLFLSFAQIIISEYQIGLKTYIFSWIFLKNVIITIIVGHIISWLIYISFIFIGLIYRRQAVFASIIVPIIISVAGGVFQSFLLHYSIQTLAMGIVSGFIFPYYTINWAKKRRIVRDGFL